MNFKEKTINKALGIEGVYSIDPDDSGGETKFGITERVARMHGYTGLMKDLPYKTAFAIIEMDYWNKMKLDDVSLLSRNIAEELIEASINTGAWQAVVFLQKSLNALNNRQKLYSDLKIDGMLGIKTIHALSSYLKLRNKIGKKVLVNLLNCLQGAFYVNLVEIREKDEKFLYGWIKDRIRIENA